MADLRNLAGPVEIQQVNPDLHISFDDKSLTPSQRRIFLHSVDSAAEGQGTKLKTRKRKSRKRRKKRSRKH